MSDWFEKKTLGALPDQMAQKYAGREALTFQGNRFSFAGVAEKSNQIARGLIQLGIEPGEKVSLWMLNRPEWFFLLFGILKTGAVLVPINTRFRPKDLEYVLKQSNSSTLITIDQSGPINYLSMVDQCAPSLRKGGRKEVSCPELPDLKRIVVFGKEEYPGTYSISDVLKQGGEISEQTLRQRASEVNPDDLAFIMYTSGTTGFPKGVMHCHKVIRNITDHANRLAISRNDVILINVPLFHSLGFYEGPLMSMITGARVVLTEKFDPLESLALIEQERVTVLYGLDTHIKDLMEAQEKARKDLSSVRVAVTGAGTNSTLPIVRKAQRALFPTMSFYGLSESGVGATVTFLDSTEEQRCEASGYPMPGYEIKIIDPGTGRQQPEGTPGEILIRGYMITQGYYNKPEETAKAIDSEGWLHSGDMGLLRQDGHVRFIGRYKDMLRVGGENVDPMEVEGFLLENPGIRQVAVVAYPDERLTEVGVAFVQRFPGKSLTEEDILQYCRGKIASFKIPRYVIFVDSFPMTESGRIQKAKLREDALIRIPVKKI